MADAIRFKWTSVKIAERDQGVDDMRSNARLLTLDKFLVEQGHCRVAALADDIAGDRSGTADSWLRLFEDGVEIGPGRSFHDDIRQLGGGRFSHWGNSVYLSSSDGLPPETNGRTYQALIPAAESEANALLSWLSTSDFSLLSADQRYAVLEKLMAVFIPGQHLSENDRIMFRDSEFRRDYERFSTDNYRSFDRKFAMREFVRLALKNEGHLAECGVFKGATAYILAKELRSRKSDKKLHLYDSFEGLSSPAKVDGDHWTKGDMVGCLDEVQKNLSELAPYIVYNKGWIPDCFDQSSQTVFSFVHIDVDLYKPTLDSLDYFFPRMTRHGILLCDDYGFATCPGAKKAFDDFFREREELVLNLPTGQGLVIRGLATARSN
jgi:O-methyltransferase